MSETEPFDMETFQPLTGLRVALSGSVPEKEFWIHPTVDRSILAFVSEFCGSVFKLGGHIVHGNHPSFTPVIAAQAERFIGDHPEDRPLTLVASLLWEQGKEAEYRSRYEHVAELIFTPKLGSGGAEDPKTRKLSLTALRMELAEQSDVMVAVGGKLHKSTGFSPGVLQELTIAKWNHLPCFVISGLGGQAGAMELEVVSQLCEEARLEPELLTSLATTGDIASTIGAVIGHLIEKPPARHERVGRAIGEHFSPGTRFSTASPSSLPKLTTESVQASADRFDDVIRALNDSDLETFNRLLKSQ